MRSLQTNPGGKCKGQSRASNDAELIAGIAELRRKLKILKAAVSLLADAAILHQGGSLPPFHYVGRLAYKRVRVTARILGPTRIDGGFLLLTRKISGKDTTHLIYLLDGLYGRTCCRHSGSESEGQLGGLIENAIRKRNQILNHSTYYFSGATGKVIKIL